MGKKCLDKKWLFLWACELVDEWWSLLSSLKFCLVWLISSLAEWGGGGMIIQALKLISPISFKISSCQIKKYLKRQNSAMSSFLKGQILNSEKRQNKCKIFFKFWEFEFIISWNIVTFVPNFPKQPLKCSIFFNIQKWPMPNHLVSGKQFQRGRLATL